MTESRSHEERLELLEGECVHCGRGVRIVLGGPGITCPDCGNVDPVEPRLFTVINRLRYKLGTCDISQQQLTGRRARIGRGSGFKLLTLLFGLWAVTSLAVIWVFYPSHSGVSPATFLFRSHSLLERFDRLSISWWVIWGTVTGFATAMALYGRALLRQRRLPELVLARAASKPAGAPHCRCCGAELPPKGLVRRCLFCQADHLIREGARQPMAADVMDGLGQIEDQLDTSLGDALRREQRRILLAVTIPLLVAAAAPVGMIFAPLVPDLWVVTALFLLFALVQITAAAALGLVRIPVVVTATVGDTITADSKTYEVTACLEGTWPTGTSRKHVQAPAWVVTRVDRPGDLWLLQPTPEEGRDLAFFLYECLPGGEPLGSVGVGAPNADPAVVVASRDPGWQEGRAFWPSVRWIDKQKLADIRFFASKTPLPNEQPIWSLEERRKLPTGLVQIVEKGD